MKNIEISRFKSYNTKGKIMNNLKGRPAIAVTWPDGQFKLSDLSKTTNVNKVTLQTKAKKAVAAGVLKVVGSDRLKTVGRPQVVFSKV